MAAPHGQRSSHQSLCCRLPPFAVCNVTLLLVRENRIWPLYVVRACRGRWGGCPCLPACLPARPPARPPACLSGLELEHEL